MPLRILQEKDFFGRENELSALYRKALDTEKGKAQSICLSGYSGTGKTEILKQLFNYLFWKQDRIAPFYYAVNNALLAVSDFSRDYLMRFICQRIAFEDKESELINIEGLSFEGLTSVLERKKATWAVEIIDRYSQCKEPVDLLRVALGAPLYAALATGVSAVVMLDEFQRFRNLHIDAHAEPMLVSLFEPQMSFGKTLYVVTGRQAEIQEMPVISSQSRINVRPLMLRDTQAMFASILSEYELRSDSLPGNLLNHLGGNPFYIKCVAREAGFSKKSGSKDLWKAYITEITKGSICRYWEAVLKNYFPELDDRKRALEIINKIYHTGEQLNSLRLAKAFSLDNREIDTIMRQLYLSGFVNGEFGVLKVPDDRVLIDFVDCIYKREITGKTYNDIETQLLLKAIDGEAKKLSYEITIPMQKEAELVAAQCLEQIGKNLLLDQELIGQLQLAVIEACINAIEHSKGQEKKIFITFDMYERYLEMGIESSGRDFISQETGEPFSGKPPTGKTERGWGIKLMKNFADSVRFEKTDRGTKVVLVKNLPSGIKININQEADKSGE
ncbi:MAG: ATP-binding protein [Nitrospiraceae bacterium]|nr:ATP-binding protein [Nitrospiraceae bacterium]